MFPDMSDVLSGFSETIQFAVVSKAIVDYELSETKASIEYSTGVKQPLPSQKLRVKPEGQRTWRWWTMWSTKQLKLDDIIKDNCNREYRVMESSDWREAGHFVYEIVEQAVPV